MDKIRITKICSFEAAHALKNHKGKCHNIHGHSYKIQVTVIGNIVSKSGMVMDLFDLKSIIEEQIVSVYDHALILERGHFNETEMTLLKEMNAKIILAPLPPTCENMLIMFVRLIKNQLPVNVFLHHIQLYETSTSFAEWFAEDN